MADTNTSSDATSEAGAMPAGVAEAVTVDNGGELGDGGKAAIAALRRELKEVKGERDTLAQAQRAREDGERTELEKATRDRDEAVSARSSLELQVLKMQAAIEAGIPEHWMRLNGKDADELAADAKEFAKSLPGHTEEASTAQGTTATVDLGAGARTSAASSNGRNALNDAIRKRARR